MELEADVLADIAVELRADLFLVATRQVLEEATRVLRKLESLAR